MACPFRAAADVWGRPAVPEVLIVSNPTVARTFDQGLRGLQVTWSHRRHMSSAQAVVRAAAHNHGLGLTVDVPAIVARNDIRVLPLPNFPALPLAVFWMGTPTDAQRAAVDLLRAGASRLLRDTISPFVSSWAAQGAADGNGKGGGTGPDEKVPAPKARGKARGGKRKR